MKYLNLVNKDRTEINYKIDSYPDGQKNLRILANSYIDKNPQIQYYYPIGDNPVTIKSRLNNFMDLELIICATKALRNLGVKEIHLYTPYFLGSRSDRQFETGSTNYLKDVICPIINSLDFESVTALDPHSDVLEACLNNFKKRDNLELVEFALQDINSNDFVLISPDGGSLKKIYKIADSINFKGDIITCSKFRDSEGKLSKPYVPVRDYHKKNFIIIDDICDGGRTFINIAKELRDSVGINNKLYLVITHGIFSNGYEELGNYFESIYCTNSYKDINNPLINQLNIFK